MKTARFCLQIYMRGHIGLSHRFRSRYRQMASRQTLYHVQEIRVWGCVGGEMTGLK